MRQVRQVREVREERALAYRFAPHSIMRSMSNSNCRSKL